MNYKIIAERIIGLKNTDLEFRNKLIQNGQLGKGYDQEMEKLHFPDDFHKMKVLKIVSAVESLDSLGLARPINVDSILIRVEESLKESGITKEDKSSIFEICVITYAQ